MKVGFDGVLLGAWARVDGCAQVLDVGTGTGLLALMVAQRLAKVGQPFSIDAVECAPAAAAEAAENVRHSPWPAHIAVHAVAVEAFAAERPYDLIVCNPPFHAVGAVSPLPERANARHDGALPWSVLCEVAVARLRVGGRLTVILPARRRTPCIAQAREHGLHLVRQCLVRPLPEKPPHRVLLEFSSDPSGQVAMETLTVEEQHHRYSAAFRHLTREFYLPRDTDQP